MTHDTNRYIIGIDPDVDKSGYALIDMATKQVTVGTATLPVLLETIGIVQANAIANHQPLTVFVEAGWLNLNTCHLSFRDSKAMAAAKGKAVGRNHQRGMDICELLTYGGISVIQVPPLRKIWKGKDRKITHEELTAIVGKIKHTNQEGRDAALLAWVHAGLPLDKRRQRLFS